MSYLVLARKFRPQTFASVVGQEHITKALASAILRGRVPHALLFTGPRGVGKTTTARLIARALNCTGRKLPEPGSAEAEQNALEAVEPCGTCTNCQEIARSSSIAVWEIDGASNNSVENVRELIESLRSLPPPGANYKIYIIDEVHMLSVAAFNALLKSLEEPPPNTIFVFATTEPHKIPETVISRCQRHDFLRIPLDVIVLQLQLIMHQEKIAVDEEVLYFIARRAQGGMRDAQTMLDRLIAFSSSEIKLEHAQRVFGVVDENFCLRLSQAVLDQDAESCFALVDEAFRQSIDVRSFVQDFLRHWRNMLLISLTSAAPGGPEKNAQIRTTLELSSNQLEQIQKQLAATTSFDLQRLFDIAEDTAQRALTGNFPRYVLEAGVAKMATLASLRPLPEILDALGKTDPKSVPAQAEAAALHPAPQTSLKKKSDEPVKTSFDPSWQGFIAHVRARKELVLEAFLRRATPQRFAVGELILEAAAFDCEALREKDSLQGLRNSLYAYSGTEQWDVKFVVHQRSEAAKGPAENPRPAGRGSRNNAVPGSIIDQEAQAHQARQKQVELEARNDPGVKEALSTFEGSSIERVAVLK